MQFLIFAGVDVTANLISQQILLGLLIFWPLADFDPTSADLIRV